MISKIKTQSTREVYDYYYSAKSDRKFGHCTIDGERYTEYVDEGENPTSEYDDLVFVKRTSSDNIEGVSKRIEFMLRIKEYVDR